MLQLRFMSGISLVYTQQSWYPQGLGLDQELAGGGCSYWLYCDTAAVPMCHVCASARGHRHHRPAADGISMKCGIYFVIYSHYFVGFRENNFPESGLMWVHEKMQTLCDALLTFPCVSAPREMCQSARTVSLGALAGGSQAGQWCLELETEVKRRLRRFHLLVLSHLRHY